MSTGLEPSPDLKCQIFLLNCPNYKTFTFLGLSFLIPKIGFGRTKCFNVLQVSSPGPGIQQVFNKCLSLLIFFCCPAAHPCFSLHTASHSSSPLKESPLKVEFPLQRQLHIVDAQ